MIAFFSVISRQHILIRDLHFTVFGQESQDGDQGSRTSSAVVADVEHNIFDLIVCFYIFEAVVEEGKTVFIFIFLFNGIQIIGGPSGSCVVLELVKIDDCGIACVIQSLVSVIFRFGKGEKLRPGSERHHFGDTEAFFQ